VHLMAAVIRLVWLSGGKAGEGRFDGRFDHGVGLPRGLLGDETPSLMEGMYKEAFIR
jgi:hypothetical protein